MDMKKPITMGEIVQRILASPLGRIRSYSGVDAAKIDDSLNSVPYDQSSRRRDLLAERQAIRQMEVHKTTYLNQVRLRFS